MLKKLLKNYEEFHKWILDASNDYVMQYMLTPEKYPCVVCWCVKEVENGRTREMYDVLEYDFVYKDDF
jgi:hypothetical protein